MYLSVAVSGARICLWDFHDAQLFNHFHSLVKPMARFLPLGGAGCTKRDLALISPGEGVLVVALGIDCASSSGIMIFSMTNLASSSGIMIFPMTISFLMGLSSGGKWAFIEWALHRAMP